MLSFWIDDPRVLAVIGRDEELAHAPAEGPPGDGGPGDEAEQEHRQEHNR